MFKTKGRDQTELRMIEEDVLKGLGGGEAVHVGGNGGVVTLGDLLVLRQVDRVLVLDGKVDLK